MQSKANTIEDYVAELPEERQTALIQLRNTIVNNLPEGFEEKMTYGMIGYVVPHSIYPPGYHCDPKLALPFINIASQKNFIALYHMGLYANPELLYWFTSEYPKYAKTKLDMGKSCVRFKKMDDIPYALIAELIKKVSVKDWIENYEQNLQASKRSK
ncbi:MAG: DUF1801 domain-containing protein [Bacteroidota bacterium]